MLGVFISVYVFVDTQTLVDIGDLSVTISGHLPCWWAHYSCCFSFCSLLNDIRSFRNSIIVSNSLTHFQTILCFVSKLLICQNYTFVWHQVKEMLYNNKCDDQLKSNEVISWAQTLDDVCIYVVVRYRFVFVTTSAHCLLYCYVNKLHSNGNQKLSLLSYTHKELIFLK